MALPSIRRILLQIEWKVPIHKCFARASTIFSIRSRISRDALLVKVTAKIRAGDTPSAISRAIRAVITRVFPDPAPAKISIGPPG